MTALREAAQQALEALEMSRRFVYADNRPQCDEAIESIRAALAQQAEPDTCTWHQDGDSDSGVYATSCRRFFNLDDGTPEDNRLAWCCYCGRKLLQELITEDGDD